MTMSILMYGLMACALVALVAALVVETLGSRVYVSLRPRIAPPASRRPRGRVRRDRDCPHGVPGTPLAAAGASRARRRATPRSCRRWPA